MCEQCLVNPIYFGEVLPGWILARARREVDWADWKKGEWGLIQCNDPTFTWRVTPTPSPVWGMTDDEEEAWYDANPDKNSPARARASYIGLGDGDDFHKAFESCSPMTGYKLVSAAMERGYDAKKHGGFVFWLFDYIGEYLKTAVADEEEHPGPFPEMEETMPSDLTIGRDPLPGEPFYAV